MGLSWNAIVRCLGIMLWVLVMSGPSRGAHQDSEPHWVGRLYDVRALEAVNLGNYNPVDSRSHLESAYLGGLFPDGPAIALEDPGLLGFPPRHSDWPTLVDWYLGEDWPYEDFAVEEKNGLLMVQGTAASHREIAQLIGELERRAIHPVEVEALILPNSVLREVEHCVLTPAEVERILALGPPLDRSRVEVPLGHPASLGGTSVQAVFYDYDVEVAHYIGVTDPAITVVYEGTQIGAVVRELDDGELLLRVWGRRGFLDGPPREVPINNRGNFTIQLPRMSSTRGAASGCIPNGGGLLLGHDGDEDGVWLVRARMAPRQPSEAGTWIPMAAVTAPRLRVLPAFVTGPSPTGGWDRPDHHIRISELWAVEDQDADDVLSFAVKTLGWEDATQHVTTLGGDLFVRGDDRLAKEISTMVRGWGADLTRTVDVDLRYGLLADERGALVAKGEVPLTELVAELDHRLRGACRVGDTFSLVGGMETMYLKDYDVQVAQASACADPAVDVFFEGITFWCHPTISTAGRLTVLVEMAMQKSRGGWEKVPVNFHDGIELEEGERQLPLSGFIEKTASSRADVTQVVRPVGDGWVLVGCHSLPGLDQTFVAVLRGEVLGGE